MRKLVVKLTVGPEDAERVSQAFGVAGAALASGADVSFWLAGNATLLATPGSLEEVNVELGPPLAQVRDQILTIGSLTVCGPCAARRALTQADFLSGVRLAGAAAFVEEVLNDDTQALVY